jgi:hypothetical protein
MAVSSMRLRTRNSRSVVRASARVQRRISWIFTDALSVQALLSLHRTKIHERVTEELRLLRDIGHDDIVDASYAGPAPCGAYNIQISFIQNLQGYAAFVVQHRIYLAPPRNRPAFRLLRAIISMSSRLRRPSQSAPFRNSPDRSVCLGTYLYGMYPVGGIYDSRAYASTPRLMAPNEE